MSRNLRITAVSAAALLLAGGLLWLGNAWWSSRVPGTYSSMAYGEADYGGGPAAANGAHGTHGAISVATLGERSRDVPDARFRLVARRAEVQLASGRRVDALTFNGQVPGPELRVRTGNLVEVTLENENVGRGVTLHWHGVDVPNRDDGVAGVTQNAVRPGERFTYRFRARQVGTFWYHTHQSSAKDVRRGLFGPFVIEPATSRPQRALDLVVLAHTVGGRQAVNETDGVEHKTVAPGTPIRLRLINADGTPRDVNVTGIPFRVAAIDGTDLHAPSLLRDTRLVLAGGGRYDVTFTMPATPVGVRIGSAGLALSGDGRSDGPDARGSNEFDPIRYGGATSAPFGLASRFDRTFRLDIDRKFGFVDGKPGRHWSVNGKLFPDVPIFVVRRGDLVKVTISNRSGAVHPMHLHGHHVLVLSRNGVPASGSPWWSDTLNVRDGERYEIAFRADNPGVWMDHCHNLPHAAQGLTMHVAYEGVSTPFEIGGRARNRPE